MSVYSITQNPGNVQTTLSDLNIGCSSFNNTCNTDGTLKYINNPVVSQCGNNVSNNKKNTERNTIAANYDTKNMLCRREVSSASSINTDNDHKIMTMLRRTGCLTLPQYQMRMLNGYNECGDVNRRSQVFEKKLSFSRNVHHLYIKSGSDNNNNKDLDKQTKEENNMNAARAEEDVTTKRFEDSTSALKRIFIETENIIDRTKTDLMEASNIFITACVKDFLEAEFNI